MSARDDRRRSSVSGRSGCSAATGKVKADPTRLNKGGESNQRDERNGRECGQPTKKKEERKVRRVKVISLGDAKTGKTCIIKRRCEGRFVSKYLPTIGVDYGVKDERVKADGKDQPPDDVRVRVNVFDLSGDPDYLDIRNEFYRDVSGVFLVFDCTDRATFQHLGKWMEEMREYGADPSCTPIVLCANKIDKPSRQVKESDGMAFASSNGLTYFETSAQSGEGVSAMFETLLQMIARRPPVSGWK